MIIFIQEFVVQIFLWVCQLIDGIMEIFMSVTGLTDVIYMGENVSILDSLLLDNTISSIFWTVFVLAFGLSFIFTIASIAKNMISNSTGIGQIIGKLFLVLAGSLAMVALLFIIIMISSSLLQLIANIFKVEGSTKISTLLLRACCGEYLNGYTQQEINIDGMTVRKLLGTYKTSTFGIWPADWKLDGIIDPDSFEYLSAMIGVVALLFAFLSAVITLARRIFEFIFLYITMPISMSTIPLDGGDRFRKWTQAFASCLLLAFSTVIAVNVYLIVLPVLMHMRIQGVSNFSNKIFTMFIIIGGAQIIPFAQQLFNGIFSSGGSVEPAPKGIFASFRHTVSDANRRVMGAGAKLKEGISGASSGSGSGSGGKGAASDSGGGGGGSNKYRPKKSPEEP